MIALAIRWLRRKVGILFFRVGLWLLRGQIGISTSGTYPVSFKFEHRLEAWPYPEVNVIDVETKREAITNDGDDPHYDITEIAEAQAMIEQFNTEIEGYEHEIDILWSKIERARSTRLGWEEQLANQGKGKGEKQS